MFRFFIVVSSTQPTMIYSYNVYLIGSKHYLTNIILKIFVLLLLAAMSKSTDYSFIPDWISHQSSLSLSYLLVFYNVVTTVPEEVKQYRFINHYAPLDIIFFMCKEWFISQRSQYIFWHIQHAFHISYMITYCNVSQNERSDINLLCFISMF